MTRHRSASKRGQSLVEAAIILPVALIVAMGGIAIDSYVQARAQVNQAVSRAALVGARNAFDPCMPLDSPGATVLPATSNGQPHGYQDVVDSFKSALTSQLISADPTAKLTITCTTQDGLSSVTTTTIGAGVPITTVTSSLSNWGGCCSGWTKLTPGNWAAGAGCIPAPVGAPLDNGCFAMWRGGIVTVSYTTKVNVIWTPFWRSVTISASAGEQIEPFRGHSCLSPPAAGSPAC